MHATVCIYYVLIFVLLITVLYIVTAYGQSLFCYNSLCHSHHNEAIVASTIQNVLCRLSLRNRSKGVRNDNFFKKGRG